MYPRHMDGMGMGWGAGIGMMAIWGLLWLIVGGGVTFLIVYGAAYLAMRKALREVWGQVHTPSQPPASAPPAPPMPPMPPASPQ